MLQFIKRAVYRHILALFGVFYGLVDHLFGVVHNLVFGYKLIAGMLVHPCKKVGFGPVGTYRRRRNS